MAKKGDKKKKYRGILLTIMLCLAGLGSLQTLYFMVTGEYTGLNMEVIPGWYAIYAFTNLIIGLVALYEIIMWKKWAVYLFMANIMLSFLIQMCILVPTGDRSSIILGLAIGLGLWSWIFYRKWHYFE